MDSANWLNSADPRRAAAAWHALMDSGLVPEEDRAAFADWLSRSPTHVEEYLRLSAVREQLSDRDLFKGISVEELQRQIGANVDALGNSVELPKLESLEKSAALRENGMPRLPRARSFQARHLTYRRAMVLAASVVLVSALGWLSLRELPLSWFSATSPSATYATTVGEQRSIVLADGSIAELNTRSRVHLHFTSTAREAMLNEGEALFHVAKDAKRPFRVYSGSTIVQAIGTEFTVRRDVNQTTVTVFEGRVSVGPTQVNSGAASPARIELASDQRLVIAPGKRLNTSSIEHVNTATALAWKSRRLVFDDLRLDAVAAEFNRYNIRQIRVAGTQLETRSITGVFNANDPDSFVSFIEGRGDVSVERSAGGDIVIRARPAAEN